MVGFDDGEGVVGGAVVDTENLKVAKGLVGEGVKGLTEVGRGVVDGDEDGEKGGRWRLSSRLGIKLVHLGLLYHMVKAGRKEGARCYNWEKRVKEEHATTNSELDLANGDEAQGVSEAVLPAGGRGGG